MTLRTFKHFARRSQRGLAFTVVELMVAVSIMTLIVLALYGMFDQVQKALRGNVAQVDVLEGGRSAMELMTREMEQIQAGNILNQTNLYVGFGRDAFQVQLPFRQELLGLNEYRTNLLQEVYFLSRFNKEWTGTGYRVLASNLKNGLFNQFGTNGVGTLARYSTSIHDSYLTRTNPFRFVMDPQPRNLTNYQRLVDGVVHFRIRAYDGRGFPLTYLTNTYDGVNMLNDANSGETRYAFTNKAVPAYLEVELGILEPQVLERLKSIPTPAAAANFLAKQTGKIHLFQQRIPIRTAK
jgi:competence protein ComGC